jgi:hypothetical protein
VKKFREGMGSCLSFGEDSYTFLIYVLSDIPSVASPSSQSVWFLPVRITLADVNEQAQERFELIEAQMRSAEGVTEDLKAQNPMEWVRRANNIRNRAQEIVLNELVYV